MKPQVKKVTEVAQGVTGAKLVSQRIQASRANKSELQSLSFNLKQLEKHGKEFLKHNGITFKDCTPANLLPFLTDKEKERTKVDGGKFSFWLVESLVVRYAKDLKEAIAYNEAQAKHEAKQVQRTKGGKLATA